MLEPLLKDDALLADIAAAEPGDGVALWWLGQSGFLVKHAGRYLLLDPYLSDSLTKKYAATDKPHVRRTARAVDPARLGFVDVVTSSHQHTDHLDAETLRPMLAARPDLRLVIPEAHRALAAERLQIGAARPIGLDDGQAATLSGFEIHAVASAHETVERDQAGRCRFLGYVVRCGATTLYHSGDTVLYDGLAEKLSPLRVDAALLPINGRRPERRVAGNLTGAEAAHLAHRLGVKLAIPCHYDMFEFNTEPPDEFVRACQALGVPQRVLRCGERCEIPVAQ